MAAIRKQHSEELQQQEKDITEKYDKKLAKE